MKLYREMLTIGLLAAVFSMSGCVVVEPAYVVNRDGHYFAGVRVNASLSEIGVFLEYPRDETSGVIDFSAAVWHAVSDPPVVKEFELFATDQPGVKVVSDSGVRPYSQDIYIFMIDSTGGVCRVSTITILDDIRSGRTNYGDKTWDEYMKQSDRLFATGCLKG